MSSSLSERIRGLSKYISIISDDAVLLEGGRKSRSPAMRKNLSILAKECGEIRKQCLEVQKNLPTKTRAPVGCNPPVLKHDNVESTPPVAVSDVPCGNDVKVSEEVPKDQAIPACSNTIKLKRARTTAPKKSNIKAC